MTDRMSSGLSGSKRHRGHEGRKNGEGEQEKMVSTHHDEPRRARLPHSNNHGCYGAGLMEVKVGAALADTNTCAIRALQNRIIHGKAAAAHMACS